MRKVAPILIGLAVLSSAGYAGARYWMGEPGGDTPLRAAAPAGADGAALRERSLTPIHFADQSAPAIPSNSVAAEGEACPAEPDVLLTIADTTAGAELSDIITALNEVIANPGASGPDGHPLAQRLREALGLGADQPPCGMVGPGLQQALSLAQLAAESDAQATAAIEPPSPTTRFSDLPSGVANGASVSGYN